VVHIACKNGLSQKRWLLNCRNGKIPPIYRISTIFADENCYASFLNGVLKVLKFKIGFYDLEKVLNLAKTYIMENKCTWAKQMYLGKQKYLGKILLKAKQFIIYAMCKI